ncbi:MAG: flagellar biosynthesis protein FlhB [Rhodospirillaceae bacterium]|nr:flagellar biosynthesis protein FlhB [Rhodospirillaceae bacterium]|tara:strand:- start:30651 stop:31745 length:1095 start_codon:yes stop_codon:yes gene_type:complete
MSEESQDKSQKTEDPTQKRLDDARQKGQVATSREVNHWFMILASTTVIALLLPGMMTDLSQAFLKFVERPEAIPIGPGGFKNLLADTILEAVWALAPAMIVLLFAALGAGLVQNGFIFAPESIKPKLEKISLKSGVKRLFSVKSFLEFAKGVFKLAIVTCVAIAVLWDEFTGLEQMPLMAIPASMGKMHDLVIRLMIGVLAIISIIAVLDFLVQRVQHTKQMRMSRQDVKDELKQTEGDPQIRARLRQIRRERAQSRMMQAVPEASVVVTNPTHFAVALKYEIETMSAPVVLAKGADHIAQRIREVAEENDVPVMQNPPLARALHATVEIGDEIPADHYKAVAEVISYVMRLKGKMPGQGKARA